MITWWRIDGEPARQFYARVDAAPYLDASLPRERVMTDAGTVRASTDTENANVTLTLEASARGLFARPPLGVRARLYGAVNSAAALLFDGEVQSVSLASDGVRIQVQA